MQEKNTGPGGYVEETQMNLIADILIPELIRHGQTVKRNSTSSDGVNPIVRESNDWGADYHIAIHSNAFKGTVRGCEVYCNHPELPDKPGTKMAHAIYDSVTAIMPVPGRGVLSGHTTMSEVAHTTAPAALIEIDYHDTVDGAAWIMSHTKELAQALLLGILKQIGVAYIPLVDPKETEITRLNSIISTKDATIKTRDATIATLNADILTKKTTVDTQAKMITTLQTDLSGRNKQINDLEKVVAGDDAELKKCKTDLSTADKRINDLEEELDQMEQKDASLIDQLKAKQEDYDKLSAKLAATVPGSLAGATLGELIGAIWSKIKGIK